MRFLCGMFLGAFLCFGICRGHELTKQEREISKIKLFIQEIEFVTKAKEFEDIGGFIPPSMQETIREIYEREEE